MSILVAIVKNPQVMRFLLTDTVLYDSGVTVHKVQKKDGLHQDPQASLAENHF